MLRGLSKQGARLCSAVCAENQYTHLPNAPRASVYSLICTGELKRAASLLSEKGWMEWLMRNPNFASKLSSALFCPSESFACEIQSVFGKKILLEKSPNGW